MTTVYLHRLQCSLFVVATGLTYCVAASPPGTRGARYILLHLTLTGLMLAVWATSRAAGPAEQRWTLVSGMLARALIVAVPSFTSSDVVRYLWDGHVALSGIDPYRIAPAVAAAKIAAGWQMPSVHTTYPTLYPPAALGLFALSASFGELPALWVWKMLILTASVAIVVLTASWLRARSLERHLPLVALSPLLILEAGVGGHVDIFAALGVVAAIYLVERRRPALAGAAIAFGVLVKLLPAFALIPLAIALERRAAIRLLATTASAVAVGYGVALLCGLHPVGSLFVFFRQWRFGSPLSALCGAHAALVIACVLFAFLGVSLRRMRGSAIAGLQWALAIPLLVSPVVFPWYLTPLAALTAAAPSGFMLGWITALPLSYEVVDRFDAAGVWQPAAWPLWVTVGAWAAGLIIDAIACRRVGSESVPILSAAQPAS